MLAWPATAAAYDLEQTDDLGAQSNWMRIAYVPSLTSNTLSLVLPNTHTKAFYRLRAGSPARVQIINTPSGSLVPDAVVDDRGTLHVV